MSSADPTGGSPGSLSAEERTTVLAGIVDIVARKLKINPWYPGAMQSEPRALLCSLVREGDQLTVHAIADHLMYCFAQSGSDWATHFVFRGEALFVGGRVLWDDIKLVRTVELSERDTDDYVTEATIDAVLAGGA